MAFVTLDPASNKMKMLNLPDADKLLALSNYLYIGAGALALLSTLAIVFFGNVVARKKETELRTYQASADVRIAEANASAAAANSAAGRANELAEKAALDKAKIERDNLLLQEKLESEREARLAIEKKIAPRYMTVGQMGYLWGIEEKLGAEPVDIVFYNDDAEVRFLAGNLAVALQKWFPSLIAIPGGTEHHVTIYYDMKNSKAGQRARLIADALRVASPMEILGPVAASDQFLRNSFSDSGDSRPSAAIRVVVGYR